MDKKDRWIMETQLQQNAKKAEAMRALRKRRKEEQQINGIGGPEKAIRKPKRAPRRQPRLVTKGAPKVQIVYPPSPPEMMVVVQDQDLPEIVIEGEEEENEVVTVDEELIGEEEDQAEIVAEEEGVVERDHTKFMELLEDINDTLWTVAPDQQVAVASECLKYLKCFVISNGLSDPEP